MKWGGVLVVVLCGSSSAAAQPAATPTVKRSEHLPLALGIGIGTPGLGSGSLNTSMMKLVEASYRPVATSPFALRATFLGGSWTIGGYRDPWYQVRVGAEAIVCGDLACAFIDGDVGYHVVEGIVIENGFAYTGDSIYGGSIAGPVVAGRLGVETGSTQFRVRFAFDVSRTVTGEFEELTGGERRTWGDTTAIELVLLAKF